MAIPQWWVNRFINTMRRQCLEVIEKHGGLVELICSKLNVQIYLGGTFSLCGVQIKAFYIQCMND